MIDPSIGPSRDSVGDSRTALRMLVARLREQSGLPAHLADDEPRLLARLRARAAELGLTRAGAAASQHGAAEIDHRAANAELGAASDGLGALLAKLACDAAEYARLESAFSPPETWLFRYPESLEFVRAFARAFERRAAPQPLRVLVVGAGGWCEPCSIAAALADALGGPARFAIEAFDRNPEVFAAPARFTGMHLRGGVPAWAEPWFRREGDALVPLPALVGLVSPRVDDAERVAQIADAPHDLVFFRNVAIYLDDARRTRLVAALASRLAPGGAMLVGHAEVSLAAEAAGLVPAEVTGSFALVHGEARAGVGIAASARMRTASAEPPARPVDGRPSRVPAERVARDPRGAAGGRGSDEGVVPSAVARGASESPMHAPDNSPARTGAELAGSPTDPARYLALARRLLAEGDIDGADAALGRALYLDRRHEPSLVLSAELAERRGAVEAAARLRERALRVHLAREESGHDRRANEERGNGESGKGSRENGESAKNAPRA